VRALEIAGDGKAVGEGVKESIRGHFGQRKCSGGRSGGKRRKNRGPEEKKEKRGDPTTRQKNVITSEKEISKSHKGTQGEKCSGREEKGSEHVGKYLTKKASRARGVLK